MKLLPFKSSPQPTLGVELEFQIINPRTFGLIPRAKDLIRSIQQSKYAEHITPEITQSMIEVNTSIHLSPKEMLEELKEIQSFLIQEGEKINTTFSGGGTHPFQRWALQKIFPSARYKNLSQRYRYLSKRSTVFGQHVHVGCKNGDDAIYLTHAMARYTPHLIAISASSPFYQGIDTGFQSSRSNVFSAFPTSGVIPFLLNWEEFSDYYYKMKNNKIISSMKDFYWDIRPKPEFGTVEIRVCDTPLTLKKSVVIAAYIQALAAYLIAEKPIKINYDLYHFYSYNRFQASRYGFDGEFLNPGDYSRITIGEDIKLTISKIEKYANQLNSMELLLPLFNSVINKENDTTLLRQWLKQTGSLAKVVEEQCNIWKSD